MSDIHGSRLGNYRLLRILGKGAFAEVHLAEHLLLKNYAAIKILRGSFSEQDEHHFLEEAQTLAQLMHPNIIRVLEFGIERKVPYLVMEYASGGTLRARYSRGMRLSLDTVVSLTKQVASALQYAHNRGVIHRDVKPENLFQGPEGVLLGDFGISLLKGSEKREAWAGTLPYSAPEQLRGQAAYASDQYALGVMVYEWLCGVRPFDGNGLSLAYQHQQVDPPRLQVHDPSLPTALEAVVLKALAKDPRERYVSVIGFAHALERVSRETLQSQLQESSSQTEGDQANAHAIPRRILLASDPSEEVAKVSADLHLCDVSVLEGTSFQEEEQLRQAVRAVQALLLVGSPQERASQAVKEQVHLAQLYRRPIVSFWVKDTDTDQQEALPPTEHALVFDARGARYQTALEEVVQLLDRERRDRIIEEMPPPRQDIEPRNPYKGLRAFKGTDRADFFGREAVVLELQELLEHQLLTTSPRTPGQRLLTILGPSGSGKSSVVMAGLLPALQEGALPQSELWRYLEPIRPGTHPLDALAAALAPHVPARSLQVIREELGRKGGLGLHEMASELMPKGTLLVLLVDQFEELFSPEVAEQERQQFIEVLVTAATEPGGPVLVLLTLRADAYDRPLGYPQLAPLVQQHHCTVLPMTSEELRAVIERPALASDVGVLFEADLIGDILFEMRNQTSSLPLLEFTLEQLFRHRRGLWLTQRAYAEIGGVRGALLRHAEATYAALPSDEHRRLARAVFLRCVLATESGQAPMARRADIREFDLTEATQHALLHEVIDVFVDARLLTSNQEEGRTTLEVSHEALLRAWPRLEEWLREARADMRLQQALSRDIVEWEQRGKHRDRLYRGTQLKEALVWQQHNTASASEQAFLRRSQARRTRGRVGLLLVVVLLLGLLAPAGVLAFQQFAPLVVTTSQDNVAGSLRQTVESAKPGSTILLPATLNGPVMLTTTLIIGKDLTIRGPGARLLTIESKNGGEIHEDGILVQKGVHVLVSDLTFTALGPLGFSLIENDGQFTLQRSMITGVTLKGTLSSIQKRSPDNPLLVGAVLTNAGTLTVLDSTITGNLSEGDESGGGAIESTGGAVSLVDSQITANTINVSTGGGYGAGITVVDTKFSLTNTIISRNTINDGGGDGSGGGGIVVEQGNATLTNSVVSDNVIQSKSSASGGGIFGADTTIKLTNSKVLNNTVTAPGEADGGGVVTDNVSLQLIDSTIADNVANGGIQADGGGIVNLQDKSGTGNVTLTRTIVMQNTAQSAQGGALGGGIFADALTMTDSQVSDNTVIAATPENGDAQGGGIIMDSMLTLTNSTVAGNTVTNSKGLAAGGGIVVAGSSTTAAHIHLANCTIAENSVAGSQGETGGGLGLANTDGTIDFCTIYGNKAPAQAGGIDLLSEQAGQDVITIKNTLIAQNQANIAPDVFGPFITGGYNLIQHATGAVFLDPDQQHTTDRSGDQLTNLGIDPQLRMNGGLTPTLALLSSSPAINQIPPALCDVTTDQRGVKRPQQAFCDIGAYEYQPAS